MCAWIKKWKTIRKDMEEKCLEREAKLQFEKSAAIMELEKLQVERVRVEHKNIEAQAEI